MKWMDQLLSSNSQISKIISLLMNQSSAKREPPTNRHLS
jgi:hypothetical protein